MHLQNKVVEAREEVTKAMIDSMGKEMKTEGHHEDEMTTSHPKGEVEVIGTGNLEMISSLPQQNQIRLLLMETEKINERKGEAGISLIVCLTSLAGTIEITRFGFPQIPISEFWRFSLKFMSSLF